MFPNRLFVGGRGLFAVRTRAVKWVGPSACATGGRLGCPRFEWPNFRREGSCTVPCACNTDASAVPFFHSVERFCVPWWRPLHPTNPAQMGLSLPGFRLTQENTCALVGPPEPRKRMGVSPSRSRFGKDEGTRSAAKGTGRPRKNRDERLLSPAVQSQGAWQRVFTAQRFHCFGTRTSRS